MATASDVGAQLSAIAGRGTLRITTTGRRSRKPHTVPIWFVVEGSTLYLGTLNANRDWVRNAAKNPDVTLDVGSISFRGRVWTVTEPELQRHVHALIARKYWMARIGSWFGMKPDRVFRVDAVTPTSS